jgi:hypothetical protein
VLLPPNARTKDRERLCSRPLVAVVLADGGECRLAGGVAADQHVVSRPGHRQAAILHNAADQFGARTNGQDNLSGCLRGERGGVILWVASACQSAFGSSPVRPARDGGASSFWIRWSRVETFETVPPVGHWRRKA